MKRKAQYRSFEDWKKEGLYVIKGEKSHKRDDKGVALFSEEQVYDPYEEYEEYRFDSLPDQW